jgi:hypothetical protein
MLETSSFPPRQTDPALLALHQHLAQTLRDTLPPPIADTPEDAGSSPEPALARRDAAAIGLLRFLATANAIEGALALQYVAAGTHADHCILVARQYPPASKMAIKLVAQSAGLRLQSMAGRSQLLALQEERFKRQAADVAARQSLPQHVGASLTTAVARAPAAAPRRRRPSSPPRSRRRSAPRSRPHSLLRRIARRLLSASSKAAWRVEQGTVGRPAACGRPARGAAVRCGAVGGEAASPIRPAECR